MSEYELDKHLFAKNKIHFTENKLMQITLNMIVLELLVTPFHKLVGYGHITQEDLLHRLLNRRDLLGMLCMLLVLLAGICGQIRKLTLSPSDLQKNKLISKYLVL